MLHCALPRLASIRAAITCAAFTLAGPVVTAGVARASFPANVRARPLRVTYEANNPIRAQIQGVFVVADLSGVDPSGTPPPLCGTMYVQCRGSEALCRMEWADIEQAARDGTCVAFSASLWTAPRFSVTAAGKPLELHPWDTHMGIPTVPCAYNPTTPDRPNLQAVACALPAPDAGAQPTLDAARPDVAPEPPRDAALDAPIAAPDAVLPSEAAVDAASTTPTAIPPSTQAPATPAPSTSPTASPSKADADLPPSSRAEEARPAKSGCSVAQAARPPVASLAFVACAFVLGRLRSRRVRRKPAGSRGA